MIDPAFAVFSGGSAATKKPSLKVWVVTRLYSEDRPLDVDTPLCGVFRTRVMAVAAARHLAMNDKNSCVVEDNLDGCSTSGMGQILISAVGGDVGYYVTEAVLE